MWKLWVSLIFLAGIICYIIGFLSGKAEIDFYKLQIKTAWERVREKEQIIYELKQKIRDMKNEKDKKYKWKDEQ